MVRSKSRAERNKITSGFFFHLEYFFYLLLEVSKQSVSSPDSEITHILEENIPKLNYSHVKLVVGGLIKTLQFFYKVYVSFEGGEHTLRSKMSRRGEEINVNGKKNQK